MVAIAKQAYLKNRYSWYRLGSRFYDPLTAAWMSRDPVLEFYSPYNFVGADPINLLDPNGLSTNLTLDENQVITSMERLDDGDNSVFVFDHTGKELISDAIEPPDDSYFYQKNEDGEYSIIGYNYAGDWGTAGNEHLDAAYNAFPADAVHWGSGGDLDFKNVYGLKNVGVMFGTMMTSRDAGNALWGGWVRNMYLMNHLLMEITSDIVAGGKEDHRSSVMQSWGWRNEFGK